ncbi:MAG: flagellar basal body-associated FliL family protein [Lachnospiraceae bacterium]|nr:flagellar basal body-associated FliL family protein [Lachnospiraceae bacterium]
MKRNLLSILILALLIVNIALTTVMMITVNNTSAKTAALVNDIAGVLNLEVNGPVSNYSSAGEDISLADTVTYDIAEPMTIPLAIGEDGASHFAVVSVSISMDGTDKEFKKYGVEGIASRQSLIKSEITEVFGEYTLEEARVDIDSLKKKILERLQRLFDSNFIYKVSFSEIIWQ